MACPSTGPIVPSDKLEDQELNRVVGRAARDFGFYSRMYPKYLTDLAANDSGLTQLTTGLNQEAPAPGYTLSPTSIEALYSCKERVQAVCNAAMSAPNGPEVNKISTDPLIISISNYTAYKNMT